MRNIFILSFVWVGFLSAPILAQHRQELAPLIEEALQKNTSLEVLELRLEVIQATMPMAGALTDPIVKLELSNMPLPSFDFSKTPMSGKQFSMKQKLPYLGKRAAQERIVEQQVKVAQYQYNDHEGEIIKEVKRGYFRLAFFDRAIEIIKKNDVLLSDLARLAKTKYAVGKGLQQDVLKTHLAQADLKGRLIDFRHQRRQTEAQLNSVLQRPPQAPIGHPMPVLQTAFKDSVESLQALLLTTRPRLKVLQAEVERWVAVEDLARLQTKPDFELHLGYRQRELIATDKLKGRDFFSIGIAANLPIYKDRKQSQKVREADLQRQVVEAEYKWFKQQFFLQIQTFFLDFQAHKEQIELFENAIIPQANQALSTSLMGYQVGNVDFLMLLESQITLFNHEIQHYHHLTAYEIVLAELEAVVGKQLFITQSKRN